jgi:hypothetical protein
MHTTSSFYSEKERLIKTGKKEDILLELDELAERMSFQQDTVSEDCLTIRYACYEITYLRARIKELLNLIKEESA